MSCGTAVTTGTVGGSSRPSREVRQLDHKDRADPNAALIIIFSSYSEWFQSLLDVYMCTWVHVFMWTIHPINFKVMAPTRCYI